MSEAKCNLAECFRAANLTACGPLPWGQLPADVGPGVYVVVADNVEAEIVYIGRTGCKGGLRKRLRLFYRHRYGKRSPHSGGQYILLLRCPRFVYWASTTDYVAAEKLMLEFFRARLGRLPYANRCQPRRPAGADRLAPRGLRAAATGVWSYNLTTPIPPQSPPCRTSVRSVAWISRQSRDTQQRD
jgi:hypothetical protein